MVARSRSLFADQGRVIVVGIDSQWDMDLMDMVDLVKQNDGVKYVLVSRRIFTLCSLSTQA